MTNLTTNLVDAKVCFGNGDIGIIRAVGTNSPGEGPPISACVQFIRENQRDLMVISDIRDLTVISEQDFLIMAKKLGRTF